MDKDMTKYIDAEKLIALLEQRRKQLERWTDNEYANHRIDEIDCILDVDINSLQQEQESIAEKFARIVRGNLIGIDKEVQQKFEQLYFEITGNKMYGGYND